jgi:hypothetical protein
MKNKTISAIVFFFFGCSLFSQNYCRYYQYINKAEIESCNKNSLTSIIFYDSAFAMNSPLPMNLENALEEAAKVNDFAKCTDYLDLLINLGVNVKDRINSLENAAEYKATSYYFHFMKDYDERLKSNQESFDQTIISQLKGMAITDQQYRMVAYAKGDTSYYQAMRETDINNFFMLKHIVEEKGWPDYRMAGEGYTGVANMVLLHGSRYFSIESKEWLFFDSVLKKEIYEGHFYPITWAQWTDQHLVLIEKEGQKYGSLANQYGELYPIKDIENIDAIRGELCLEPLKDYMKKKGYAKILEE